MSPGRGVTWDSAAGVPIDTLHWLPDLSGNLPVAIDRPWNAELGRSTDHGDK